MSRLCAKPTCSEPAAAWIDVLREERRVIAHDSASPHGLALCQAHLDRFVVPAGWELHKGDRGSTTAAPKEPHDDISDMEPLDDPRSASSERPWFLAGTPSDVPVRPLLVASDDVGVDESPSLASGSLLRRAFNGPERNDDQARRAHAAAAVTDSEDTRYDRETERAARSLDEYGTAQLPFPPFTPDVQAAVS